jgi:hypothetical protein
MRTLLCYLSLVKNYDFVTVYNGGKPMSVIRDISDFVSPSLMYVKTYAMVIIVLPLLDSTREA